MAAGDVTYSAVGQNFACGIALANDGADVEVLCGFVPDKIVLHYKDTGATTVDRVIMWLKGMTAGYYWKTLMSNGVITLETSGGPTVLAASETNVTGEGFTIPDAIMDADSDTIYWEAWRAA